MAKSLSPRHRKISFLLQDYISSHLEDDLSLQALAEVASLSPYHLHRIFTSATGETPHCYIKRIRLEHACFLLSKDEKVINIAYACGFATHSSFSKAFGKRFGLTPSEYRKSKNGTYVSNSDKDFPPITGYTSDRELSDLYQRRKKMNVKLENLEEYRIAYLRQIGPYGEGNRKLMQDLKRWAATRDLLNDNAKILGIAHDDPQITPADKCRYDTCLVIPEEYALEESMNEARLPGGLYAVFPVAHTPEAIAGLWKDIFSFWLPESGHTLDSRPVFERYRAGGTDIMFEPEVCEICVPLAPKP